jgi:hypothetical protein
MQRTGAELSDIHEKLARVEKTNSHRTHFRAEQVLASLIKFRVRALAL